uniref:Putative ovule protein n=1 Tax=Solanum chacoense TaxID=4108 RepID=A0A0V0GH63_SOLCH
MLIHLCCRNTVFKGLLMENGFHQNINCSYYANNCDLLSVFPANTPFLCLLLESVEHALHWWDLSEYNC